MVGERRETKRSGCEEELVRSALNPLSFPDKDILALLATFAGGGEDWIFIFHHPRGGETALLLFRLLTGNAATGIFPGDAWRVN